VLIGSAVAVGLGVFGKVHEPQFFAINVAGSPAARRSRRGWRRWRSRWPCSSSGRPS
jgi:hypothetical protein